MEYLTINSSHVVQLDNSFDTAGKEIAFTHTVKGEFGTFWAYTIYNDICNCCGYIKRQVAVEINYK